MADPVLDTVVLQVFGFGYPHGLDLLVQVLGVEQARFPAEVYNEDEEALPLYRGDEELSELARGLRYAQRRVKEAPQKEATRYQRWLDNATQLFRHLNEGTLYIDSLNVDDLLRREMLMDQYGIGRGEAACITLAERHRVQAVFVSADEQACRVAQEEGLPCTTIHDILERWVNVFQPERDEFDALITGMREARYDPGEGFVEALRRQL